MYRRTGEEMKELKPETYKNHKIFFFQDELSGFVSAEVFGNNKNFPDSICGISKEQAFKNIKKMINNKNQKKIMIKILRFGDKFGNEYSDSDKQTISMNKEQFDAYVLGLKKEYRLQDADVYSSWSKGTIDVHIDVGNYP